MSFPKQEYVTVLKNPETRIDIGELTGTESCFRRGLSRLRNNTDRRNVIIGLLIVIMLICLMDRLQNDSQAKRNEKVLKEHAKILEYLEIRSQLSLNKDSGTKTRSVRTVTNGIPHFYLEGWRGNYGSTDATDVRGIFRWKAPDNTPFDRTDYFYADKTGGYLTKVHISRPGVYFIFAKVTANGRDSVESDTIPPVGIVLMKNDEELEKAWVTQDERGRRYSPLHMFRNEDNQFPLNTLTIMGLHTLSTNDQIYIQRPPDRISSFPDRFLAGDHSLQFGAFLVEGCLSC